MQPLRLQGDRMCRSGTDPMGARVPASEIHTQASQTSSIQQHGSSQQHSGTFSRGKQGHGLICYSISMADIFLFRDANHTT